MLAAARNLGASFEGVYPGAVGVVCGLAGYTLIPDAFHILHEKQWVTENIFVAVFTLGTVAAGFGLAIYTFLLTTESGFIGRAKRSLYYKRLLKYLLVATTLSVALAILSVPGMVIKDAPARGSLHSLYLAVWAGWSGWTTAAVYRAGRLFATFAAEHH